jgi:hypothetical protein
MCAYGKEIPLTSGRKQDIKMILTLKISKVYLKLL